MNREQVIRTLAEHQAELKEFKVKSLELFGSIVRGEANERSDVDLLVEFDPEAKIGIFHFLRVKEFLEQILGVKKVDLVTYPALHPLLKDRIISEKIHAF